MRVAQNSQGGPSEATRHPRTSSRVAHCLRQWASKHARCRRAPTRLQLRSSFLIWIARNPLKSPESDEGIQENPSPFSWSGLVWIWFGLEKFGLSRSAERAGRSRPARPSPSDPCAGSFRTRPAPTAAGFSLFRGHDKVGVTGDERGGKLLKSLGASAKLAPRP